METKFSYLKSQNAEYIEELFARYCADPNSVDATWRFFFEGMEFSSGDDAEHASETNGTTHANGLDVETIKSEFKVYSLIDAYRRFGTYLTDTNPIEKLEQRKNDPPVKLAREWVDLAKHGLTAGDLERRFQAGIFIGMNAPATLREIIAKLEAVYCQTIGFEFDHIQNAEMREWLQKEIESSISTRRQFSKEERMRALEKLTLAESFERFLHTRYVAKKRFSLEGGDNLIPMLDTLISEAADTGVTDMVIGMAHRGRLNVLTNIFGKNYEYVFAEFTGKLSVDETIGSGDVKYHMGYSCDYKTQNAKSLHLSLASNPSHLEFVNPVVEGMVRAKQERIGARGNVKEARSRVVPLLIHGDAAFAGQGICYETIQMSQLNGYSTGGTLHVIVNNQVGFTTNYTDARSTHYSSDVMKMLDCPIFHINGDDAEAAVFVAKLAMRFRQKFQQDVMIELICYRKYGHNEGDEPSFTQPMMYKTIKDHPSPREVYAKTLADQGVCTTAQSDWLVAAINERLNACNEVVKSGKVDAGHQVNVFGSLWKGLRFAKPEDFEKSPNTGVDEKILKDIGAKLGSFPKDFTPHPKLVRLLEQRAAQSISGEGIDWGTGEALSFGSLLWEGTHIRLIGQDCERGTFSHRHAVLNDFNTGLKYIPLNNLKDGQGYLNVYNSFLSENAALGFEYGFASADPKSLVIWEAQFGDFINGAQVIVDQFLTSSETKWARMCGLTLLLPHGFEGQGPEHSSARLERFLQSCAENNIQVCNLTTPAQIFHALRRQIHREFRKPLIVMSPKSLLRHPEAVSKTADFVKGSFQEVIDDPTGPKSPRKVVFCTGKIYYELVKERVEKKIADVAIVRIEQLYPWPKGQVGSILKKYASAKELVWAQEEPKNMGSWHFVRERIEDVADKDRRLSFVGRPSSSAPANGSDKKHEKEQHHILEEALS